MISHEFFLGLPSENYETLSSSSMYERVCESYVLYKIRVYPCNSISISIFERGICKVIEINVQQ